MDEISETAAGGQRPVFLDMKLPNGSASKNISLPLTNRHFAMNLNDLAPIGGLASTATALRNGVAGLVKWQAKRREANYQEFIRAALEGGVFPENGGAMAPEDLYAILQAIELDMDELKAPMYGRLACSIESPRLL